MSSISQDINDNMESSSLLKTSSSSSYDRMNKSTLCWISSSPAGEIPSRRAFHSMSPISLEKLILFGGCNEEQNPVFFNDLWLFDNSILKWKLLKPKGDAPSPRSQHVSTILPDEKQLLIYGGFNGRDYLNDLYIYNIETNVWSKCDVTGDIPAERAGHSLQIFTGVFGSTLLLFGGKNHVSYFNDTYILDLKDKKWIKARTSGEAPSPRSFHTGNAAGKDLYIFGGEFWNQNTSTGDTFNDLFVLNTISMRWTKVMLDSKLSPSPRCSHTTSLYKNSLLVFGGNSNPKLQENQKTNSSEISFLYSFNIDEQRWEMYPVRSSISGENPRDCHNHAAVLLHSSKVFIFGGIKAESATSDMIIIYHLERMDPEKTEEAIPDPPVTTKRRSSFTSRVSPFSLIVTRSKEEKEQKKSKKEKSKANMQPVAMEIGLPTNIQHLVHVDFDYKWTGQNPAETFVLQRELGSGAYGTVYQAHHRESGYPMAIKQLEIDSQIPANSKFSEDLKREIEILKKCRHSNVVSYFGTVTLPNRLWIMMDLCELGSIRDLLETSNEVFLENEIAYVMFHTLRGLVYLHSSNIIHRDVKAANILLTKEGQIKIADFGISDTIGKANDMLGTPLWMAPEVISKASYDAKCDIWSLGITIIEMSDGFPPHHKLKPKRAMMMVPMKPPPNVEDPSKFSPEFNQFLSRCLVKEPSNRATALELLQHPFMQSVKGPEVLQSRIKVVMKINEQKNLMHLQQQKSNPGSDVENSPKNERSSSPDVDLTNDKHAKPNRTTSATKIVPKAQGTPSSSPSSSPKVFLRNPLRRKEEKVDEKIKVIEKEEEEDNYLNTSVIHDDVDEGDGGSAILTTVFHDEAKEPKSLFLNSRKTDQSSDSNTHDLDPLMHFINGTISSAVEQCEQRMKLEMRKMEQKFSLEIAELKKSSSNNALRTTPSPSDNERTVLLGVIRDNLGNLPTESLRMIRDLIK